MNVVRPEGGGESWEDQRSTSNKNDVRVVLIVDGKRVCMCPLCRVVRGQLRETREALSEVSPDPRWPGAVREGDGSADEYA